MGDDNIVIRLSATSEPKVGKMVYPEKWPVLPGRVGLMQKGQVEITYINGTLYLAFEGHPRFAVVKDIPHDDYRPCISIGHPGQRVKVLVRSAAAKRQAEV